ncbi:MAG: hypothetical protein KGL39_32970, partial [Patescibacteria group bacterium]|nr:hypothetical protein [Patescibacteria group bacterium]
RAARELGWAQISAEVRRDLPPQHATAAAAAANMVRTAMPPLDQWRAMKQLRDDGYTIEHAATCLGLSVRLAQRLEKLGRLHPDMLALIEELGMPADSELAEIANAPPETQAQAIKTCRGKRASQALNWHNIVTGCLVTRIPRRLAAFDVDSAGVVFEEDLFAEPGDEDAIATTNVAGFLAAQRSAMERLIAEGKGKIVAGRVEASGALQPPKGFTLVTTQPRKLKAGEVAVVGVVEKGYHLGSLERVIATRAAEPAGKKGNAKSAPDPAPENAASEAEEEAPKRRQRAGAKPAAPAEADAPEEGVREPITAQGRALLARAATEALRQHLRATAAGRSAAELLGMLLLALGARQVAVKAEQGWGSVEMRDLARHLVPTEGAAGLHLDGVLDLAGEALARIVRVWPEELDPAVEWIGHAAGADAALPRFDTPDFLAHVSGAELRRLATEARLKPAKSVAGLREQLAGALPTWRPVSFGAPGPTP